MGLIRAGPMLVIGLLASASAAAERAEDPVSPIVDVSWLARHRGDRNLIVIHVGRDRAAYDSAHVPGARFLAVSRYSVTRDGIPAELPSLDSASALLGELGVGPGSRLLIYGQPLPVARLWYTLDWLGLGDRAFVLDGGLAAWTAAGHAVATADPAPWATTRFEARPRDHVVVDADWVAARLGQPGRLLLDARAPDEFSGAKEEEGVTRRGHIPGAALLDWTALLNDGRYRSAAELTAMFQAAGASATDELVAYCRSGMRAAVVYLAARSLGYRVRMYDGSMVDWSARTNLPITVR